MNLLSKLGDLNQLRQQAQNMKSVLDKKIITIENDSLYLKINGRQEILELKLKDGFAENKEKTERDLTAAWQQAKEKIQSVMFSKFGGLL